VLLPHAGLTPQWSIWLPALALARPRVPGIHPPGGGTSRALSRGTFPGASAFVRAPSTGPVNVSASDVAPGWPTPMYQPGWSREPAGVEPAGPTTHRAPGMVRVVLCIPSARSFWDCVPLGFSVPGALRGFRSRVPFAGLSALDVPASLVFPCWFPGSEWLGAFGVVVLSSTFNHIPLEV
jgi:hypothetical protein